MDDFGQKLGIRPIFGGYHKTQGTKNALINLDNGIYLELLAKDDTNTAVPRPRWMGVDVLKQEQLTRWAFKSDNLERDGRILRQHLPKMGSISGGSRKTANGSLLTWELIMPLPKPEVEIIPFAVDWGKTETHPTDELPKMGCGLVELYATHPNPELFRGTFEKLGLVFRLEKSKETRIRALVKCPQGQVEI